MEVDIGPGFDPDHSPRELQMTPLRSLARASLAVTLLVGSGTAAHAQVFTPTFMAPRAQSSLGIYLSDFYDLALEGIARGNFGGFNLGVRGGIVDADDATGLMIGGELRNPLSLGTAPLDLSFTAGIQGLLGDFEGLGVQAGLSLGHTFVGDTGELRITPYIHPRVAFLDGPSVTDEDGDLELLADVGVDLDFATNLSVRFGAYLGDGANWGIGLAWR
jgi:hypothetical protein